MKLLPTLVLISSLSSPAILFLSQQSLPSSSPQTTMTDQSVSRCTIFPVQSDLRLWLDPIPKTPISSEALPPGVNPPPPQPQGTETHALNLELTLTNSSQRQQYVKVLSWYWSQGQHKHSGDWSLQPDMSPLNRYVHIQRELVKLQSKQVVKATIELEINGQSCNLEVQTEEL